MCKGRLHYNSEVPARSGESVLHCDESETVRRVASLPISGGAGFSLYLRKLGTTCRDDAANGQPCVGAANSALLEEFDKQDIDWFCSSLVLRE